MVISLPLGKPGGPSLGASPQPSDEDIRGRIARQATKLFAERGYGATSVSRIVAAAGVTKPVLYYYFGSKAGLFDALFEEHFHELVAILERAEAARGPIGERLLGLTRDQFAYSRDHLDRLRFVLSAILGPQRGLPHTRLKELNQTLGSRLGRILAAAVARGELRDQPIDLMGMAYVGMVHMYMMKHVSDPAFALSDETAARLVDLFLEGAGNPTAREESSPCAS